MAKFTAPQVGKGKQLSTAAITAPELVPLCSRHHTTYIHHPISELLESMADVSTHLLPIHNKANRHEPRALVDDPAVASHTDQDNEAEVSLYSLTTATRHMKRRPSNFNAKGFSGIPREGTDESLQRLLDDMRALTTFDGRTALEAVVFQVDSNVSAVEPARPLMVHVERTTEICCEDHQRMRMEARHTFPLNELLGFQTSEQWVEDLTSVIFGKTDRDVRHMRYTLEMEGELDPEDSEGWKPKREPPYADHLDQVATAVDAESLCGATCISCTETFDNSENIPLALAHDSRHLLCRPCLLSWCQANGAVHAGCVECRAPIFTDESIIRQLVYGIAADGKTYHSDERYDAFENGQRACADLDKYLASDGKEAVKLSQEIKEVFLKALEYLLGLGDLEPPTSTPYHMQPGRSKETRAMLVHAVNVVFDYLGCQLAMTSYLFGFLRGVVYRYCANLYERGGAICYFTPEEREAMQEEADAETVPMPDGFEEFIDRLLNRLLQLYHVRRCGCSDGAGQRTHYHGLRLYYSDESEAACP